MLDEIDINGWEVQASASNGFRIYREVDYEEDYSDDPEKTYEVIECVSVPGGYKVRVLDRCHTKKGIKHGEIVTEYGVQEACTKEEVIEVVEDYTLDHPAK